jgi:hypothetical protein
MLCDVLITLNELKRVAAGISYERMTNVVMQVRHTGVSGLRLLRPRAGLSHARSAREAVQDNHVDERVINLYEREWPLSIERSGATERKDHVRLSGLLVGRQPLYAASSVSEL